VKKIIIILSLLVFAKNSVCQNPSFAWAKQIGGAGYDMGNVVTTDFANNVYVGGRITPSTADGLISKYNSVGILTWSKQFSGTGNCTVFSMKVDASGNVYSTGYFNGQIDFDPNAGVFSLTSLGGSQDVFITKLDAAGNFVWAKQIGNNVSEWGYSLILDGSSNVFVAGAFVGTVDFDPGAGVSNLVSNSGSEDIFVLKLDAAGNFMFAKNMGGGSSDNGYSIALDPAGNIYTTGRFNLTSDFDPNAGVQNLTSAGSDDIFISKLDNAGNFVWAKRIGGASSDFGWSIFVDASSNVYTTGKFFGNIDFDPGASTFFLNSGSGQAAYVNKLDGSGNFIWAKVLGGGSSGAEGISIALDANGFIYSTGYFFNSVADFDPGAGTFNLTPIGFTDIYVSKLDPSGNFVWAGMIGSTNSDYAQSIAIDGSNSILLAGYFNGLADLDPTATTFTANPVSADIYLVKLGNCSGVPVAPSSISGMTNLCSGTGSSSYSISLVSGATSYMWSLPGGWSGSSATNTISATPGSTGIFTVTASNACGTSPQQTLNVTVNPLPTITVNSGSICSGSSFTIVPGGANTYTIQGGSAVVSPTATNSYTVIGTSTAGCVSSSFATSNVIVNTLPTITVNSGSICSGSSFTIAPGGANTYTIQGGSAVVSPTATISYTVTGTSTAGCVSAGPAVSNVTVNSLPVISANSGSVCSGQSFTITPSGANTYTFSGGPIVTPTTTSSYSVTGTSSTGCTSSASAVSNVTVNSLPIINANTSNTLICTGQSATLTATGANTFTWNPGGTGNNIVISPTVSTTYTVTGINATGCSNTSSFTQSVSACTGLSSVISTDCNLSIFPNPTNGVLSIKYESDKFEIKIYNSLGELVSLSLGENSKGCADLSSQSAGIYFIKVGSVTKKLIKE
jgi:hypothetical protein